MGEKKDIEITSAILKVDLHRMIDFLNVCQDHSYEEYIKSANRVRNFATIVKEECEKAQPK